MFSGGIKWEHWLELSLLEKYLRKEHIVIEVVVSNICFEHFQAAGKIKQFRDLNTQNIFYSFSDIQTDHKN